MKGAACALLLLAMTACDRESAPSDTIRDAADSIVGEVGGAKATPKLAEGPYAPRDECTDLAGADAFRRALTRAVAARDADALAALAAPDVKMDFGGGSGAGQLRARLTSGDEDLWSELDALLALGCAKNAQGGIVMPWYFPQKIEGIDPARGMIVTAEDVPLRKRADAGSEALAKLSWDVVELSDGLQPEDDFQKVTTADGTATGFVASNKLRSLLDYRLIASSRDGKWSFTSLVAGD